MLFKRVNTVSLQQTSGLGQRWGQVPGHSNILGVKIRLGGLTGFNSWCSVLWGYCSIQLMGWSHTLLIPKPTKCFGLTKDTRECFAECEMSISHLHVELVPKCCFGVNLQNYDWSFWSCSLQEHCLTPFLVRT